MAVTIATLVIAVFVSLRIDLGPSLRALAERQASRQIERPVHIGRLMIRVARGNFELDDFSIEGVSPDDRPDRKSTRLNSSHRT